MKHYLTFSIITLFILFLSAFILFSEEKSHENIVARIGSDTITEEQLNHEIQELVAMAGYKIEDIPEEIIEANKKEILEKMVNDIILEKYIESHDIEISQDTVDSRIKEIVDNYPSEADFEMLLQRQGFTMESFTEEIKKELYIETIIKDRGYKDPTDEDMKAFYEDQKHGFHYQDSVEASHILLSFDNYEKEAALKKITEIKSKINDPSIDFPKLAEEFSDCPSSQRGGELGFFERGRMVEAFEETAFSIDKGSVSNPVETQFGYHLIYVTDSREAGTYTFEEKKEEIKRALERSQKSHYVNELLQDLKEQYKVEILN